MAVAREIRERDGLKLYRNALSRRLLAAEGEAEALRAAFREFPELLYFDLWKHPSGAFMLCRTDNRPATLAKDPKWAAARGDLFFAGPDRAGKDAIPAMSGSLPPVQAGERGQLAVF